MHVHLGPAEPETSCQDKRSHARSGGIGPQVDYHDFLGLQFDSRLVYLQYRRRRRRSDGADTGATVYSLTDRPPGFDPEEGRKPLTVNLRTAVFDHRYTVCHRHTQPRN